MNELGTSHTGPLGSTIHVLRADADTIVELAAVDWNRHFRRVCLDPVRGVITLVSPSRLHEDLIHERQRLGLMQRDMTMNHSWPVDSRYRKIGREHAGRPPGRQESAGLVSGCDGT